MKRILILLLSLVLVFSLIACGGGGEQQTSSGGGSSSSGGGKTDSGGKTDGGGTKTKMEKVTMMSGGASSDKQYIDQVIADFEEINPNIDLELIWGTIETGQRLQAIMTALKGKQPDPDTFTMDVAWVGQIAASGWLLDMGPYNIDTSNYFQSIIELADKYQGKLIALPTFVDGGGLYYRTDLMEKYGYGNAAPELWSELVDIAKTVQAGERAEGMENFWGYVWQGKQYEGLICDALEFFASAGGNFMSSSGEVTLDSNPNKKALQFMHDLIHVHQVSPPNTYTEMKEEEARMMFQFGNAMFERNWPYAWTLHQTSEDSAVIDKFAVAPLPHFPGQESASCLGGWHLGVSKFSDSPDGSVEWAKYYNGFEANKLFALKIGWNPARKDVYEEPEIKEERPHMIQLKELFEGCIPRPGVPYYTQMSDIMQKYFNSAIAGTIDVDEALSKAQSEVEDLVAQYE